MGKGSEDVHHEHEGSCAPLPRKERKDLSASAGPLQRQLLRGRLESAGFSRWVRMHGGGCSSCVQPAVAHVPANGHSHGPGCRLRSYDDDENLLKRKHVYLSHSKKLLRKDRKCEPNGRHRSPPKVFTLWKSFIQKGR